MWVWWRGKRKIPADKNKAKEVKRLLKECKNTIEQKRVNIMVVYLWWADMAWVYKALWGSKSTIENTIKKYLEDETTFYKTQYKGKIVTEERKNLKEQIREKVENSIEEGNHIDISDIVRHINKAYNKEVIDYQWVWRILRKFFWYNYQKPFVRNKKSSEYAKEIIKWRLTKTIIKVWLEENNIDAESIKNKKMKIWRVTT